MTREEIEKDSTTNLYASTGIGKYKYISYKDTENDGDIDKIYFEGGGGGNGGTTGTTGTTGTN